MTTDVRSEGVREMRGRMLALPDDGWYDVGPLARALGSNLIGTSDVHVELAAMVATGLLPTRTRRLSMPGQSGRVVLVCRERLRAAWSDVASYPVMPAPRVEPWARVRWSA